MSFNRHSLHRRSLAVRFLFLCSISIHFNATMIEIIKVGCKIYINKLDNYYLNLIFEVFDDNMSVTRMEFRMIQYHRQCTCTFRFVPDSTKKMSF